MVTATYKQYDIASHEVMYRLIYVKWKHFGQYVKQIYMLREWAVIPAQYIWVNLVVNICFMITKICFNVVD